MPKRLLSYDPQSGLKTYHEYNHKEKKTIIHHEQDIEHHLERNKMLYNQDNRQSVKKDWWYVGYIPQIIIMKWLNEDGIDLFNPDHWPAVKRKLNSNEYRYLRTSEGRV